MNQQMVVAGVIGILGLFIRHVGIPEQNVSSNGSSSRSAFIGATMCIAAVAYVCSNMVLRHMHRPADERVTNGENVGENVSQEGVNSEASNMNESNVGAENSDIHGNGTSNVPFDNMSAGTPSSDLDSNSTASDGELEEWDLLVEVEVNICGARGVNHE
ncbi:putative integral membrane protein [Ehrlichia ruminantium]|uniref:hypothetical protein n=1 Tax=Ehrlichia ruminantium TaxID=779 RepID=UPI0007C112AC|nr:hypothetical protein [Ehrlichia ruminantium]QLK52659.1 hypothetical protein FDZ65_04085 [Ehrlichia ruminantium]QLK53576.1 hypothetical protein FDZ64_04110 [Ehrlichia ruminantium]QLK54491.1 hypothetical protein FDZ63_04085 [Ehrlichia ruminantium]QLK58156.1 hypothetical protein FDZ59_04080 [Ehrlichia ruminantium]GAT76588.1 putative integral membrane protein [Ehrlichia ruminantium]